MGWCNYNLNILNDVIVKEKLKHSNFELRNAGNGLWICILLPAVLLSSFQHFETLSELYKIICLISVGQFVSSCCDILHRITYPRNANSVPYIEIGYLLSSTLVSLLLVFLTDRGVIYSLSAAICSSFAYHWVHENLILCCPRSFTYGEATLVSQSVILYLCSFVTNVVLSVEKHPKTSDDESTIILQGITFAVLLTLLLAYQFKTVMRNVFLFFPILLTLGLTFVVIIPYILVNVNAFVWLYKLIYNYISMSLITFWIICCYGAVFCLLKQTKESTPVTTVNRKSFHFLVFFVFIPGLVFDSGLMYAATGIGFGLLVTIEICRKLQLTDYSKGLQMCFDTFKDEKDEGEIAFTPLYLMIGCAAPMWIFPFSITTILPLPILSGIFPVAVGDAAASLGGMWFGKHRWHGSCKTIEGSVCCFLSQILTFLIFAALGIIEYRNVAWSCVVFFLITLVEAKTDQIDNLVLPFICYILFMIAY